MKCNECGSQQIEHNTAGGVYVCIQCGKVLESNTIVSELQFSNSMANGYFLNQKTGQGGLQFGKRALFSDSRTLRLSKGYKVVDGIASQLGMSQYIVEAGQRFFKLAYEKNFIQGRNTRHVAAVCLYIACRKEKTPHLLIDFSDVLQTNVYILGSVYLKLVQRLFLEVPLIDPSIFIHRFCSKLEFEGKSHQVALTALRLLQTMKRAWITTGRRPNGLCGAAILIAARYHNYKRNIGQIVRVVHVCEETIRKRLDEFKNTRTAQLTRDEFQCIESGKPADTNIGGSLIRLEKSPSSASIEENMDPPSFTKNLCKKKLEIQEDLDEIHKMIEEKANQIEQRLVRYDSTRNQNYEDSKVPQQEEIIMINTSTVPDSNQNQLVPYFTSAQGQGQNMLGVQMQDTSRLQMALRSFEDNDGVETLSDVDDAEIDQLILTEEERKLKTILWNNLNKDWIQEQYEKKRLKKEKRKLKNQGNKKSKQIKKQLIVRNATNPIDAIRNSAKLGNINPRILESIFKKDN
ncbi:transcription factor iiib 90 kda subunit [Stylonychia lemnae]|uniref:B-related factor 1 n=1 Tax=Stylonychia lemnae TaxID=5949 RepID=A0A077ZRC7_STYLE|nr:transcription factor iiib 90 kda subunit [Stylonychia lemnae]|eukprot:CDW72004.1 transcription factor iiib 90 kda subunit [Stylonychia lemnae]